MMMSARYLGECPAMNLPPRWLIPEMLRPPLSQMYEMDVNRRRNDFSYVRGHFLPLLGVATNLIFQGHLGYISTLCNSDS